MNKIYLLNWDYNHSGDLERDAFHIKFPNSDKASTIFLNSKHKDKLPQKILYKANFNIISKIDYPLTDLNIPILSDRMIDILKSVGTFKAILTPVIMIDDTYLENVLDAKNELKPDVPVFNNYKALTIIERENCFDYNNSIFEPSELNPEIPGYIKKLVLKFDNVLPPIFRIKESPSKLIITGKAKEVLESNNIKGCVFEEVETT